MIQSLASCYNFAENSSFDKNVHRTGTDRMLILQTAAAASKAKSIRKGISPGFFEIPCVPCLLASIVRNDSDRLWADQVLKVNVQKHKEKMSKILSSKGKRRVKE